MLAYGVKGHARMSAHTHTHIHTYTRTHTHIHTHKFLTYTLLAVVVDLILHKLHGKLCHGGTGACGATELGLNCLGLRGLR